MYNPETVFYNLNMLNNHHLLPEAGGVNDQHPHDMHDLRILGRILRRLQWEWDQDKRAGNSNISFDNTRDFFDADVFQQPANTGNFFKR